MPSGLTTDIAKEIRAEKRDQKHLGHIIGPLLIEMGEQTTAAPAVDGGFGIAGEADNIMGCHNIRQADEQSFIVAAELFCCFLRQKSGKADAVRPSSAFPAAGIFCVRVETLLMQVSEHIPLSDFITVGFSAVIVAVDSAALEKLPGGGLADVADLIKLLLADDGRDGVPVGPGVHK